MLTAAAVAVAATAGVATSVSIRHGVADMALPVSEARASTPPLRRLVPADRADPEQLRRQLAHLTEGNVVLDLRALESVDAAETLVRHWRDNHPADGHLVCWLAAEDDNDLGAIVGGLSEWGCSALHVALDRWPDAHPVEDGNATAAADRRVSSFPAFRLRQPA